MIKIVLFALLALQGNTVSGLGRRIFPRLPPQAKCEREPTTIMATSCKIEYDEECTTESKVVGDRVTHERGDCEEVEVCKPPGYFVPRHPGGLGFLKKREADADPFYDDIECEKETKEVCKRVPVKTPVEREVETCVKTPKEVCESVEKKVAQITCAKIKRPAREGDDENDSLDYDFDYLARFG